MKTTTFLTVIAVTLLLSALACQSAASVALHELSPTPTVTPTPRPIVIGVTSPVAGSFQLAPVESRRFEVIVDEPGFLLVRVQWQVTGNGLEVIVEASDSDPAFLQQLQGAGLPALLLEHDLTDPEGEFRVPISPEYVGHPLRVTLRNATDSATQGNFSVALELQPTPTPVSTATPTATPTPSPTATPPSRFKLDVVIEPRTAISLGASVSGAGEYEAGTEVKLEARRATDCLRASNYVFSRWQDVDNVTSDNTATVVMESDRTVVAVYEYVETSRSCLTLTPIIIGTPLSLSATLKLSAEGISNPGLVTFEVVFPDNRTVNVAAGDSIPVTVGSTVTVVASPETFCVDTSRDLFLPSIQSTVWFVSEWRSADEFSGPKAIVTVKSDTSLVAVYASRQRSTAC